MKIHASRRRHALMPRLETCESIVLQSGFANPLVQARAALVERVRSADIATDPAGVAAIINALRGGAGSEFVSLIRRQVPNLGGVIRGFVDGSRTQFTTPGFVAKTPNFQELYTSGPKYDHLSVTAAGALLLRNRQIELAAITRGPFDEAVPAYVVFGIDRGAGASVGPRFANRPGITPDFLVTVRVGPYGASATGTTTDLTTGMTTTLDSSRISVQGPVVRVFLDATQIPSAGLGYRQYRFAMWTQNTLGGIETVGSFAPEASMLRFGQQMGRR